MELFDFLQYTLTGKGELLKFAEAKNATLLVASTGVFALLIQAYTKDQSAYEHPITLVLALIFLTCALLSAWSFLPQSRRAQQNNTLEFPHDSLLYYKDVADFTVSKYGNIVKDIPDNEEAITRLKDDFVEQIILNSRIINRKMKFFSLGIYLFLAGISGVSLAVIFSLLDC